MNKLLPLLLIGFSTACISPNIQSTATATDLINQNIYITKLVYKGKLTYAVIRNYKGKAYIIIPDNLLKSYFVLIDNLKKNEIKAISIIKKWQNYYKENIKK